MWNKTTKGTRPFEKGGRDPSGLQKQVIACDGPVREVIISGEGAPLPPPAPDPSPPNFLPCLTLAALPAFSLTASLLIHI